MADLNIATFEQIETILIKIATAYSSMALTFYDVFYNPIPKEVTFQMYNEEGILTTYTIPNRAMDFRYILNGAGAPENEAVGQLGSIYQDTTNGDIYVKKINGGSTGWDMLVSSGDLAKYLVKGIGNPNGQVSGYTGLLYIDGSTSSPSLYIKTTPTGTSGWTLISANTSNLAAKDLSNVTAAHFVVEKGSTTGDTFKSWYRLYNDGWCEQWGTVNYGSQAQTIYFLKNYSSLPVVTVSASAGYANVTKYSNAISIRGSVNNTTLDWSAGGFKS